MPSRRRRRLLQACAAAPALAALGACERKPAPSAIGFLGGLTGSVAELGVEGRNGCLLAIETLNAQAGRERYRLLVEDDRQDPAVARAALQRLVAQHVLFVVGPMTSEIAIAVLPQAQHLQVVLISPTATSDDLSGQDDVFFRVAAEASVGARQLADRLVQHGASAAAVAMDARNASYSHSFGRTFAGRLQARGARLTATLDFGANNVAANFAALAPRLLAGQPQWVLIVAGVGDSALLAQQLRHLDPQIGIAITPWAANPRFLEMGGRAIEGCVGLQALDLGGSRPALVAFRRRYRERFGEDPSTPAVQAYEALMTGARAAAQAGAHGSPRAQLARPQRWPGLYSDIELDRDGDTQRPLHLVVVRDGRFVSMAP